MKTHHFLRILTACAIALVTPDAVAEPPAAPKPPAKPQPKPQPKPQAKPKPPAKPAAQAGGHAEIMKKYDLDHNKNFNVTEARTIQDDFKNNPQDPLLKKYDADKNGLISDTEIMKITPPPPTPPKPKPKPKAAPKKPQKKK